MPTHAAIRTSLVPLVALLGMTLALSSCGDDRTTGMIITSDGRMFSNNATNNRLLAMQNIDSNLQRYLGDHWRSQTEIAELPVLTADYGGDAEWQWQKCTVTITLVTDGKVPEPVSHADIVDGVRGYLVSRTDHPKENLSITITEVTDAARLAALINPAAPAPQPAPAAYAAVAAAPLAAVQPAASGASTYIVESGDTLAEISSAYYGSPGHWHAILAANPGLDPAILTPGTKLLIPALPAAAAPALAPVQAPPAPPATTIVAAPAVSAAPAAATVPQPAAASPEAAPTPTH